MTKAHNSLCFECFNERAVLRPRRFSSFSLFFLFLFLSFCRRFRFVFFSKQKIRRMGEIDDDKDDDSHARNRPLLFYLFSERKYRRMCTIMYCD